MTMVNVALQEQGGRPCVSSHAYANYRSMINDGIAAGEEESGREVAWSSASERLPQWAAVVFRRRAEVSRAVVRWAMHGSPATSRRFEVQIWSGGAWKAVARLIRPAPEPATEVIFDTAEADALRIWQEAGCGPAADPDRMSVAELEVYGGLSGVSPVRYQEIRESLEREWEESYGRMRSAATLTALRRMDAVAKRHGGGGPIGPEQKARGRLNGRTTVWGRVEAERILADANWWLDKDDAFVCDMIVPENPRAISPSYERGCPIHGGGRKCMRTNTALSYRWQCAIGGEWWHNGAKVKNPATGEEVVVWDDGDGWIAPPGFANPGTIYYFQAAWRYYVLSKLFYWPYEPTIESPEAYTGHTALTQLALAYALTEDARYGHRAAVMLNRLAEVYRFYTGTVDEQRPLTRGYLVQVSWEEGIVHDCAAAYDLVIDLIESDEDLLAFFRSRGDCDYNGDGRVDAEDIRYNIQHNLFGYQYEWLRRVMPIQKGDYVVREALALYALGLTFQNQALVDEAVDGPFGLAVNLTNNTFRDGKWWYDAPGYAVSSVTESVLRHLPIVKAASLFDDPRLRLRQLVDFSLMIDCDGRLPAIGDTGGPDSRLKVQDPLSTCGTAELAYLHTGDRRYLSRFLALSGGDPDGVRGRYADSRLLFNAEPAVGDGGELVPQTVLFHDSGIAILRTGRDASSRKHLVLNFGKGNAGHGHRDKLSLNVIAYGYDLAADLGYPTTFTHRKVAGWETHTMSHATVCIDGRNQELATGSLEYWGRTPATQVVCASGARAYPGVAETYRRTVCLVDVSDTQAYVFDVFVVKGGARHDYVFRSLSGEKGEGFAIEFEGEARTEAQAGGSLSGPEVPFGGQPGMGFIKDVARTRNDRGWRATWRVGDAEATGIRLTMLGAAGREVITGRGEGYGFYGQAPWDACVVARSSAGAEPSVYTAVLEPFQGGPAVKSVVPVAVSGGTGARVDVPGRRDYLLCRTCGGSLCRASIEGQAVSFDGEVARVSIGEAGETELHLIGGSRLTYGEEEVLAEPPVSGRVEAVNVEEGTVIVESAGTGSPREGDVIVFRNGGSICSSSYEATSVEAVGPRRFRVSLSMSLILSGGVVERVDAEGGGFATATCMTKLEMCPGLFDGKSIRVGRERLGAVEAASPDVAGLASRSFVNGVQTDAEPSEKAIFFRLDADSRIAVVKAGDRFLVSDLDEGDAFQVMRSTYLRLPAP